MTWLIAAGVVAFLLIAPFLYLSWYVAWETRQTAGLAYYGRPVAARRALKRRIRYLSGPIKPLVRLLSRSSAAGATMPSFEFRGVSGPPKVSSPAVFERASQYRPQREDVFVVTQMRCGTTWMQQLVYETLSRGQGNLGDDGYRHLYAMSPWIDAINSVPMDAAPLVGQPPRRIIKSHLPTALCPYAPEATYIYVTRDPVSCFASIVDYNRSLLGPLAPPVQALADWFCSDRMYWSPWPRHVAGWWDWAERYPNVLFVHFEEMKADFASVQAHVERALGVVLSPEERARVADRCSFRYMQAHEEEFEMAPPTMFSVAGGKFLARGRESGREDVTPAIQAQIVRYCRQALQDSHYPAARFYPAWAERPPA